MNENDFAATLERLLPSQMLLEFRQRAATYDANNEFFTADLEALKSTGYLAAPVPPVTAPGGRASADAADTKGTTGSTTDSDVDSAGLSLEELVLAQRRLAQHAPATALGVNMHLVWVQVARFLHDRGIGTLDWVLEDAARGEIFAFGISEAGNEAVLLDANTVATPLPDGAFEITGTKIFTTLSPVWTRLGIHAKITSTPENVTNTDNLPTPETATGIASVTGDLVFGFIRRPASTLAPVAGSGTDGGTNGGEPQSMPVAGGTIAGGTISHPGVWNPLGMRATQSYTTRLAGVRLEAADVAARFAPFEVKDPLILAIFSSFSVLTAAVYAGIADRALELARLAASAPLPQQQQTEQQTEQQQPDAAAAPTKLQDPEVAARLTAANLAHHQSTELLTLLARDIDEQRARPDWFLALAAARNQVTDEARAAVDTAMRVVGASAFNADSELARLYRDVLAGMFHPSSSRALARTVRAMLA